MAVTTTDLSATS